MKKIIFASICPHPAILLPDTGTKEEKKIVRKTVESLISLAERIKKVNPDRIVIFSPHEDWGFKVPLYFLADKFGGSKIKYLTSLKEPEFYFEEGKKIYSNLEEDATYGLIASGDLSHRLKEDGPYGFSPEGPVFDAELIDSLQKKDVANILQLYRKYPEAADCGLRPICFMLGILEAYSKDSGIKWDVEILSYEGPFGVGYLTAGFNFGL